MFFQILVEDRSGEELLKIIVPKIIGTDDLFEIKPYKGCGRLRLDLPPGSDPSKRQLLDQLPKLLDGFGKTWSKSGYEATLVVVCDLDARNAEEFLHDLEATLKRCKYPPKTHFCLAIEEGEAWLLGDIPAILKAYPNAKKNVLNCYQNDSICGTWETLADALYKGGAKALKKESWFVVGKEKSEWAKKIAPYMTVEDNLSPSFQDFRRKLLAACGKQE